MSSSCNRSLAPLSLETGASDQRFAGPPRNFGVRVWGSSQCAGVTQRTAPDYKTTLEECFPPRA